MSWDEIEIGFAGGDETLNFGPRVESGSLLYQVNTLATVSNSLEVGGRPSVCAALSCRTLCVAADQHLTIFDENCQKMLVTLIVDSTVDALKSNDEGDFILLAERSGSLNFIATDMCQVLYKQALLDNDSSKGKCFTDIEFCSNPTSGTCSILVLACEGKLFHYSNINFDIINEAIDSGDLNAVKDMLSYSVIDLTDVHKKNVSSLFSFIVDDKSSAFTGGEGGSSVAAWQIGKETTLKTNITDQFMLGLQGVKCRGYDNYVFVLNEEHHLNVLDADSLILISKLQQMMIKDFCLMEYNPVATPANNFAEDVLVQVVVLTLPDEGDDPQTYLKVINLPGVECVYSLAVSPYSTLAQFAPDEESIYFVEGTCEDDSSSEHDVTTLRIRCLTEALPENRFSRLLQKKNYDEALSFARLFNLSEELVYKSKASHLLDMMKRSDEAVSGESFAALEEVLDSISDTIYLYNLCDTALPSYRYTSKLLCYVQVRLSSIEPDRNGSSDNNKLLQQVQFVLHSMESFVLVHGESAFSKESWYSFQCQDCISKLLGLLEKGKYSSVLILWMRHKRELLDKITVDSFGSILSLMSTVGKSGDMVPWLRHALIPFVSAEFTDGKLLFVRWLREKAQSLEISEKTAWPHNAISLIELFFEAEKLNINTECYIMKCDKQLDDDEDCAELVNELKSLLHQLKGLLKLEEVYKCKLSWEQYVQETVTSITFRLLDRVAAPELIPKMVKTCIAPYADEHRLNLDKVLYEYIEDGENLHCSIQRETGRLWAKYYEHFEDLLKYMWRRFESPLEARALAIIDCIKDTEFLCQAILTLTMKAPYPWSQAVKDLMDRGLQLDHPLVDKLKGRQKMLKMKAILTEYDLGHFDVRNEEMMAIVAKNMLQRVDAESVVEDAMQVISIFPELDKDQFFLFRIRTLIEHNQIFDACSLLKKLDDREVLTKRMISLCQKHLEYQLPYTHLDEQEKEINRLYYKATLELIKLQTSIDPSLRGYEEEEMRKLAKDVKILLTLQDSYETILGLKDLHNKAMTYELFYGRINQLSQKPKKPKDPAESKSVNLPGLEYYKVQRFGELLGIPSSEVKQIIASKFLQVGRLSEAMQLCSDICEPDCTGFDAKEVFKVLSRFCEMGKVCSPSQMKELQALSGDEGKLFTKLYELACITFTWSDPDDMMYHREWTKLLHMLKMLNQQCDNDAYGSLQQGFTKEEDPFLRSDWLYENSFIEDAFIMDAGEAIPRMCAYNVACNTDPGEEAKKPPLEHWIINQSASPENIAEKTEESIKVDMSKHSVSLEILEKSSSDLILYLQDNNQQQLALKVAMETFHVTTAYASINSLANDNKESQNLPQDAEFCVRLLKAQRETAIECVTALLQKIFACRVVDQSLALGYLMTLGVEEALETLRELEKSLGLNFKKIQAIADLGCNYCSHLDRKDLQDHYSRLKLLALWGQKLSKLKISFKDAFLQATSEGFEALLPVITSHHKTSLDLILGYCSAFQLNKDDALLMYISQKLLPNTASANEDVVLNVDAELDAAAINAAVKVIENKELLMSSCIDILNKVDSYDYERLQFILQLLYEIGQEEEDDVDAVNFQLTLLDHLRLYKRCCPPSEYEMRIVSSTDELKISPLSSERLPFHPLVRSRKWDILTPELNENTVNQLVPIVKILQLSLDHMYVTTINNIVSKIKVTSETLEGNNLDAALLKILENAKGLLLQIQNMGMAVAVSKILAKSLPNGTAKMVAFRMCVRLAEKWEETTEADSPEKEKAALTHKQLVKNLRVLSMEHALTSHKLGDPEYTRLLSSPARLIFQLYKHPLIETQKLSEKQDLPDIHKIVEKIADINNIDLPKIRSELLKQWLSRPACSVADDTTSDLSATENSDTPDEDESYFWRIRYLLEPLPSEEAAQLLLDFVQKNSQSYLFQWRAMLCLCKLVHSSTIEIVSGQTIQEVRSNLKVLKYLSQLEELSYKLDMGSFEDSNKRGLVMSLWRKHKHDPKALRLIAELCLDYPVDDSSLWTSVLQQMLKLYMFDDLKSILLKLGKVGSEVGVQCLSAVWWGVLSAPFLKVHKPLRPEDERECQKSLLLLQSCPVIQNIDVVRLHEKFLALGMLPESLACLMHITNADEKHSAIQEFMSSVKPDAVLNKLNKLETNHQHLPEAEMIQDTIQHFLANGNG